MKFGGSSVGSAERIKATSNIIISQKEKKPIVVLSAVCGITDKLIAASKKAFEEGITDIKEIADKHSKIIKELNLNESLIKKELEELKDVLEVISKIKEDSKKILDIVCSFGERMSVKIVAAYLNSIGIKSESYNAYDIGFVTNSEFTNAELLPSSYGLIKESLSGIEPIAIITGFIAKNKKGQITTLGRGGSDYTAAIIGATVGAEEIQIWTDVDGIMTTDPRIIKEAKSIPKISFNEAAESAYFGAKVLHPKTIVPAVEKDIPVKVLNSFNPEHEGTTIVKECTNCEGIVRIISLKRDNTILNITSTRMLNAHGFLAKVFEIFARFNISVDMIATSEVSISLTIDNQTDKKSIREVIKKLKEFSCVTVQENKPIICLIGNGIKNTYGLGGKIFAELGKNNINVEMVSQGASEVNVGFVVDRKDAEKAIRCLHKRFFGV